MRKDLLVNNVNSIPDIPTQYIWILQGQIAKWRISDFSHTTSTIKVKK